MKKLLLSVLGLFLFIGASYAQEYKPFKIGLGLGYAIPGGEGAGGGILIYGEPMYRINDAIAVGLRVEGAIVVRGYSETNVDDYSLDAAAIGSYTLSGQYYFSNATFRPLVGAGFGIYSLAAVSVENGDDTGAGESTTFGFYPRVGFDAGHFNFMIEYNIVPNTKIESTTLGGESVTVKNSYLSIKAGASILGGRRK
ncbi:hypothetical protein [Cesiribacter sp. SM1]|uniref:hypothetical protein n=1 Tax=Cesiribacter sp. SM1 TaxID=2861196 RepID=UPI001CD1CFAF|nr:hypothetical protein [Cesiribacter sp. SM1]